MASSRRWRSSGRCATSTTPCRRAWLPSDVWEAFVLGSLGLVVVLLWIFMRRYTGPAAAPARALVLAGAALSLPVLALLDPLAASGPAPALVRGLRRDRRLGDRAAGAVMLARRGRQGAAALGDPRRALVAHAAAGADRPRGFGATGCPSAPPRAWRTARRCCCARWSTRWPTPTSAPSTRRAAHSAELERRVHERTRELERTHERLRALERTASVAAERERLMRDMHDGIGSQLITTLEAVERGSGDARRGRRAAARLHRRPAADDRLAGAGRSTRCWSRWATCATGSSRAWARRHGAGLGRGGRTCALPARRQPRCTCCASCRRP